MLVPPSDLGTRCHRAFLALRRPSSPSRVPRPRFEIDEWPRFSGPLRAGRHSASRTPSETTRRYIHGGVGRCRRARCNRRRLDGLPPDPDGPGAGSTSAWTTERISLSRQCRDPDHADSCRPAHESALHSLFSPNSTHQSRPSTTSRPNTCLMS